MTGPAQTPVLFLKAGGSAFFSADCQALLIAAKLNPDWFGSYDKVNKKIQDAKTKCANFDRLTPAGQARVPASRRPTPEDRFLADSTAGHLVQDGVYRNARDPANLSGRNNPCARLVDGYVHGNAPAVPTQGTGPSKVPGSVEVELSAREIEQRRAAGGWPAGATSPGPGNPPPANPVYNAGQLTTDENARSSTLVNRQQQQWDNVMARRPETSGAQVTGSGLNGAVNPNNPAEVERARAAVGAKPVVEPTGVPGGAVTGNTAEECINNWRERAKDAMKAEALDAEIARQSAAARRAAADPALPGRLQAAHAQADARKTSTRAAANALPAGSPERTRAEARAMVASQQEARARERADRYQNPDAAARLRCLQDARAARRSGAANDNGRTSW